MDPQRLQKLLKKRAEELSKPIVVERTDLELIELLVFKLAEEEFAIETKHIKEVYPLMLFTPLPGAPPFVMGLVNLRRKIVVVIDLKVFFSLAPASGADRKLLVLQDGVKEFAIVTDGICGIRKIPVNDIQGAMPTLTGLKLTYLLGVTSDRIVVLDGSKLLSSTELVVDESVEV